MQDPNILCKRYERITNLLRTARKAVPVRAISGPDARADIAQPGRPRAGQDEFEKFMSVGEYEFAWAALMTTAAAHLPRPEFWETMAEAAVLLVANAHAPDISREVQSHLRTQPQLRAALDALPSKITDQGERAALQAMLRVLEGV